jgi:hypothetical protein
MARSRRPPRVATMTSAALTPHDVVGALRSFPRRYREETALRDDEDPDELWHRPGPAGRTVLEIAVDTVRSLSLLDRALEQVLVTGQPALHPAVTDRHAREYDVAAHGSVAEVLDELDHVAGGSARRAERAPADDWLRTGRVTDETGSVVTALDIAREAVDTGAVNLREIRATMAARRDR